MSKFSCAERPVVSALKRPATKVFLLAVFLVGTACTAAHAAVSAIDDVLPADDLSTGALEGLAAYPNGNSYNANDPVGAQTRWEKNEDIIVGEKLPMGGRLDIDGNSKLRFQDLIIGDQGDVGGQMLTGTGSVLISGIAALYSNNPNSLPPGLPSGFGVDPSVARATNVGFDLYVGRWGQGKLELRGGGRAEIQDAVIVGDNPGSSGEIIVDGFGSLLANGGFDEEASMGEAHQIIVGRTGFGRMTIRNGGLVVSEAPPTASTTTATVGAVIGSDAFNDDIPEPGGTGIVTINGLSSKWIVGGSLQIGGFHDSFQGDVADFDGDNVQYNSEAGRGTLQVEDDGVLNIRPAIGADPEQDDLLLVIGRFGRLELSGGLVTIGNPGTRTDNIKLLNDGVITGSGRIETGVFRNRYVGEVRVDPGQSLVIDSTSEFITPAQDSEPLANWGVIRVLGTADARAQLEFERAPDAPMDPIQPFRNLRVQRPAGAPPADFYGGLISAQHATLSFRSNIENTGMMAFTDGDNYVTGHVFNLDPDLLVPDDEGIIFISGPDTKVVFENDLLSTGTMTVEEGADVDILADHSFVTAGTLNYNLNPSNTSQITTAGDVGIAGKLAVTLTGFAPGSLSIGDSFEIISFGGDIGGVDLTDPLRPLVDLTVPPLFTQIQMPSLVSLGLPASAVMLPIYTSNSVLLSILSIGGAMGPDFNGDGVVDALDLAIWKANKGITMGATILQGDANGDGAVDGADYIIWLQNLGPYPGSGGGAGGGMAGNVPEPTSLAMLFTGGVLALACRRRRI